MAYCHDKRIHKQGRGPQKYILTHEGPTQDGGRVGGKSELREYDIVMPVSLNETPQIKLPGPDYAILIYPEKPEDEVLFFSKCCSISVSREGIAK